MKGLVFASGILAELRLVVGRHDLDDARMGFRRGNVEKGDAAARDAAHRQHRIEHAGRMIVGRVTGGAGDLKNPIAAGQRLTDIRAVPNMGGRLCECDLRHG